MADYNLQIKITGAADGAIKAINDVVGSLRQIARESGLVNAVIAGFSLASRAIDAAANSLDRFSKVTKKFGREFTQNVTLPVAALAGISLKKVFDEAYFGRGSAVTNAFAGSVQALNKEFKALIIEIGTQLAPFATQVVSLFRSIISAYQQLNPETKQLILTISLIAGAIGPVTLAFSSFIGVMSKVLGVLAPVVAFLPKLLAFFTSPVFLITALGASIIGLTNVFLDLRKAGVETSESLLMTFNLFVTGFNNYIVTNILLGVRDIIDSFRDLGVLGRTVIETLVPGASVILNNLDGVVAGIDSTIATMEARFLANKTQIDDILKEIGTSAGNSFTLGASGALDGFVNQIKDALKGSGEAVKTFETEIKASAHNIQVSISGGLASSFLDIAEGSKTAEQAFKDFARSTIRQLTQMIIQAQLFRLLFPEGGALSGATLGVARSGNIAQPRATGGLVSGPGSSTSDSILTRLSNGEYVSDAKTVRTLGTGFFQNLKRMAHGGGVVTKSKGPIPSFADGGLVGTGGTAPQVVIQNSGAPKEATETSYDPATAVTTVVLEDLQKNGSISKSMQRTFGFRRGGFR